MLAETLCCEAASAVGIRKILVASDGSSSAAAAVLTAGSLARADGASVDMVAVYVPDIPLPARRNQHGLRQCEASDRGAAAVLLHAVRQQRLRLLASSERRAWPVHVEVGDPGATVVRWAADLGADIVVLGIGHADPAKRRDTHLSLCVARYLSVPLLAAIGTGALPRRAVIAFPDGRVHGPTIRSTVSCVATDACLWVVVPKSSPTNDLAGDGARKKLADALGDDQAEALRTMQIEWLEAGDDTIAELLRVADQVGADLIAVPNRGAPGAVRIFLPNIAEPVLLGARCSVLVVPDAPPSARHCQ